MDFGRLNRSGGPVYWLFCNDFLWEFAPLRTYPLNHRLLLMKTASLTLLATTFVLATPLSAKKTHSGRVGAMSPAEELAGFTVPDGFVVELVASEEDGVINPIDLSFDDAGRLWTQTARMYPLDPVVDIKWGALLKLMDDPAAQRKNPKFKRILDLYQGKTKGEDQIIVLSNLYGEGGVEARVWADGLTIPQSILPYKDGAFVAQGSELFYLRDSNHDGKADQRTSVLTGFGYTDTHTMAHLLVRGPGDWVHFSQGALNKGEVVAVESGASVSIDYSKIARFSLDGSKIELVSSGLNNIWGFQLRHNGQWYGTEANDLGFSIAPMEPGSGFKGIGNARLRPYQPWLPDLHTFRVGGTGISGLAFSDDVSGSFPTEWRNVALLANAITSTINAVEITREADGSVTARHLPDLLTSEDDWFRPVNMEFGPDGCLYVADWYNKIVSHNELPTTHPDRDKSRGRIWRIRHESQVPRPIPNLYEVDEADLVGHLAAPSLWEKRAAWHQIVDRHAVGLAPALVKLIADSSQDEITRIHALWSLEGLGSDEAGVMDVMELLLQAALPDLRREAVRAMGSFAADPTVLNRAIGGLVDDENPMVRAQVLRTLAEFGQADSGTIDLLVRACRPELPGNAMGGPYERKFERYLSRKALEQYPSQLTAYLGSPALTSHPVTHALWAIQSLPGEQRDEAFLKLWTTAKVAQLDEPTFVAIARMLGNKSVYIAVAPTFRDPAHAAGYVAMALQFQNQVQSPQLAAMLQPVVLEMLASGDQALVHEALMAVARLNVKGAREAVTALIHKDTPVETLSLTLAALESDPIANKEVFKAIIDDQSLGFGLRLTALHSLAKGDPSAGLEVLRKALPARSDLEKKEIATVLSGSKQGAGLLMKVYKEELLSLAAFDLSSAERTFNANPKDPRGVAILAGVRAIVAAEKKAFAQTFGRFMGIAEAKGGRPETGKVLFESTCLLCHKVGTTGQEIAPALDGSAHRENEALLTALLDPDVAIEGGYVVYRVTKKDGSSLEGFLSKDDARGVTLAFMGGTTIFIPTEEIQSKGFLGGRSFMPKGLVEGWSDEQIADLLSYIRTLE